ncbi:MAG: hypothetical protein ATN31_10685 [Candidatus Epulonipiscioides saccharophilum]|nr:MAG: hypothetical protein ATN31_10685 [Epulopiscium sp. AS2M-Bin001]
MYKIRAHHGVCIQLFRGRGYSVEFVENMTNFIKILKDNPKIEVVAQCDVLCASCPHKSKQDRCGRYDKVLQFDNNVLTCLNIEAGQKFFWNDFRDNVRKEILENNKLQEVCNGCSWLEFCLKNNRA